MQKTLFILALVLLPFFGNSQPYGGTIFVDPDIILPSDSSTLVDVVYTGQGNRVIFDRRVNSWININAFLFEVSWNDGLNSEAVINPEFETIELAQIEAEKYGWSIGQLPYCLRLDVNEIWVNKGVEPFGGGNNSILIHTGQTVLYENDGILEETLVHEASHTSLDAMHAESPGWVEAQGLDGVFISDYAENFPDREDIAESFLMWLAVRHREDRISSADFITITQTIPNRLNYFDGIACDLFPFQDGNTTPTNDFDALKNKMIVYPNPTADFIYFIHKKKSNFHGKLYNAMGDEVLKIQPIKEQKIDLSHVPSGLYFFVLNVNGEFIKKRIVKY